MSFPPCFPRVVGRIIHFRQLMAIAATFLCSVLASTTSVQRATFLSRYSLESCGWQWREYGRSRGKHARLGTCLREGQVECHFVGLPQGKNNSSGIGDAWHPQKPKWAAATITKLVQKLARIVNNQWKPNISPYFPFSQPTKAPWIKMKMKGIWRK